MKINLLIICLIFVLAQCNNHKQKVVPQKASTDNTHKLIYNKPASDSLSNDVESAFIHADSARIYGQLYKVFLDTSFTLYVVKKKDSIIKMQDVSSNISFYDFNGDGFKDYNFKCTFL